MTIRHISYVGLMIGLTACSATGAPKNRMPVAEAETLPKFIGSTTVPPIDQTKLLKRLLPEGGNSTGPRAPAVIEQSSNQPAAAPLMRVTRQPVSSTPVKLALTGIAGTNLPKPGPSQAPVKVKTPASVVRQPLAPPGELKHAQSPPVVTEPRAAPGTYSSSPVQIEPPLSYEPW